MIAPDPNPAAATKFEPDEQRAVLKWLLHGGSPAAACRQAGLAIDGYHATILQDEQFAAAVERVQETLSQNVAAALYQSAMKGNVSAQSFWLRHRPPPGWRVNTGHDSDNPFQSYSDAQLIDTARAHAIDFPPDVEARLD